MQLADDVLHHVNDDVGAFVKDDDVSADDAALVGRRKGRKFATDFDRAGLKFLLQAWGQSAVAFELFFKSRRQIAAALGQAGRQAGAVLGIVRGHDEAVPRAEAVHFIGAALIVLPFVLVTFVVAL